MKQIQLHEAKSTLSKVVNEAVAGHPSAITRHGKPEAVIVGFDEWTRLNKALPSFADFLLAAPFFDEDLPTRSGGRERDADL